MSLQEDWDILRCGGRRKGGGEKGLIDAYCEKPGCLSAPKSKEMEARPRQIATDRANRKGVLGGYRGQSGTVGKRRRATRKRNNYKV